MCSLFRNDSVFSCLNKAGPLFLSPHLTQINTFWQAAGTSTLTDTDIALIQQQVRGDMALADERHREEVTSAELREMERVCIFLPFVSFFIVCAPKCARMGRHFVSMFFYMGDEYT